MICLITGPLLKKKSFAIKEGGIHYVEIHDLWKRKKNTFNGIEWRKRKKNYWNLINSQEIIKSNWQQ